VPDRYDDGGLSGASLDRPALQALLAEVGARKVDVVAVYKVDRLTRSLADFAKLIELFDAHAVSFVSVPQSFNTTTSMGRLTLNILLSFAQFEREVIGERVRDKIAASKRKGIWVGGPVPLGYAVVAKKRVVVPADAKTVRMIFTRYLAVGSVQALAQDLSRTGIHTKERKLATGRIIGGGPFGVGALAYLLRNRFYVGEVVYRGETFSGDHEPILNAALFAAVLHLPGNGFAGPVEPRQEKLRQAGPKEDQRRGLRILEPGAGRLTHEARRQSEHRGEREQLQRLAERGKAVGPRQHDEIERERRQIDG
jgi:DNA invertase Pin-like site-specific DNA recombinase